MAGSAGALENQKFIGAGEKILPLEMNFVKINY
jgi:hypothetical protein